MHCIAGRYVVGERTGSRHFKWALEVPIVLALAGALTSPSALASPHFTIEDVPRTPYRVGDYPSIAVSPTGVPHIIYRRDNDLDSEQRHAAKIAGVWQFDNLQDKSANFNSAAFAGDVLGVAYQDAGTLTLHFAILDGTLWVDDLVDGLFPQEGYYASLAFDSQNLAHIGYQELSGANNLKHAFGGIGTWLSEDADGAGSSLEQGRGASLAIGPGDSLAIAYVGMNSSGQFELRFAELTGGAWQHMQVDGTSLLGIAIVSMAFTPTGSPAIAYAKPSGISGRALYYTARGPSNTWSTPLMVDDSLTSAQVSLCFDGLGQGHILYGKSQRLCHAYQELGPSWVTEVVDVALGSNATLSLTADSGSQLHAAYHAVTGSNTGLLRYAHGTTGSWTKETVEGADDCGRYVDLSVDAGGNATVAYYNGTYGNVDLAYRTRTDFGGDWSVDDVAERYDVGRHLQLAPAPPQPRHADLVYYDATNGMLRHSAGQYDQWSESDAIAVGTSIASMGRADSAGWARMAVYDSVAGQLSFVRLGPGTPSRVVVDASGDVGRSCSAVFTSDGIAHLVYVDTTHGFLKHAKTTGVGWQIENIDASGSVGGYCALGAYGGIIRAVYYDGVSRDLRSADVVGGVWQTSVVDAAGDVGSHCALTLGDFGEARVTYYDATHHALRYAARCPDGSCWSTMEVDASDDVGRASALRIDFDTNKARIAYYDATRGIARYAEEYDPDAGVPPDVNSSRSALRIVPNPATGRVLGVELDAPGVTTAKIEVYDVTGRSLGAPSFARLGGQLSTIPVRISALVDGVVFVRATLPNGKVLIGKTVMLR